MKRSLFLGIDGGGTKTKASLISADREWSRCGVWRAINYNSVGKEQVMQVMREILTWARNECPQEDRICGIGIAAAGISNGDAAALLQAEANHAGFQDAKIRVMGDHQAALMGAMGRMEGMILIVGTGSICLGVDSDGNERRTGGWGHIFDDWGSGYDIGRQILAAIARAHDGRGKPTVLTEMVFSKYALSKMEDLIRMVYSPETKKQDIARLAQLLEPALAEQDEAAIAIGENTVASWCELVRPVAERCKMAEPVLALCGSIAQHNVYLQQHFEKEIGRSLPGLKIVMPQNDASVGAALLAML